VSDVTRLLDSIERGESKASAELLPLVYEELRVLAAQRLANEAAGHTLQPTALVHEAWLRPEIQNDGTNKSLVVNPTGQRRFASVTATQSFARDFCVDSRARLGLS